MLGRTCVECIEVVIRVLSIFYHMEPSDVWHQGKTLKRCLLNIKCWAIWNLVLVFDPIFNLTRLGNVMILNERFLRFNPWSGVLTHFWPILDPLFGIYTLVASKLGFDILKTILSPLYFSHDNSCNFIDVGILANYIHKSLCRMIVFFSQFFLNFHISLILRISLNS